MHRHQPDRGFGDLISEFPTMTCGTKAVIALIPQLEGRRGGGIANV